MKKIFTLLLLACLCKQTSAQVIIALLFGKKLNTGKLGFGLVLSPSLTNVNGTEGDYRAALSLGLYFNIEVNKNLFLHLEAIPKGAFGAKDLPVYSTGNDSLDNLFRSGSIERKIQTLSLPLLVHYRIKNSLFLVGGPQVDLITKVKDNFEAKVNENPLNYLVKVTDQFTRFDLAVNVGLMYQFKKDQGMGIGLRYYYGMTDILKTEEGTQVSSAFMLNITIPIGAGKANEAKAKPSE
jgi:hypothetical protein